MTDTEQDSPLNKAPLFSRVQLRKYFFNTSWLITGRGIQLLLSLLIGVWLTRYLGPAEYGNYAFILSFAMLFAPIANLGLGQIIVLEIVKAGYKPETILGTSLGIRLGGTAVAFLLMAISILLFVPDQLTRFGIALAGLAILLRSAQILIYYFQANIESRRSAIPHIISLLLSSAAKVLLMLWHRPMIEFVYVVMFDAAIYSLFLLFSYSQKGEQVAKWQFDFSLAKKLIRDSWPLMFSLIIFTFYMQIDQVMIKLIRSSEEVGYYSAAVRLSTATYALPWVITGSLFPAIIRTLEKNKTHFLDRMGSLYSLLIYFSIALIIPTVFFADEFIVLLFGKEFEPSAQVLIIHICASLFVFLGYASDKWLIAGGLQIYSFISLLLGAVLNVVINSFLIPKYGITGAAWATLFSQMVSYMFAYLLFKQTRPIFILQLKSLVRCFTGIALVRLIKEGRSGL